MNRVFLGDLERIFQRRGKDGQRVYSKDEVRAYLFRLFLEIGPAAFGRSGPSVEAMLWIAEYSLAIGITPGQDAEEMKAKVLAYYKKHPIRADLRAEVEQVLKDASMGLYEQSSARRSGLAPRAPMASAKPSTASYLALRASR
jgi:hypothetical protein